MPAEIFIPVKIQNGIPIKKNIGIMLIGIGKIRKERKKEKERRNKERINK
jgi:hypothetical protein